MRTLVVAAAIALLTVPACAQGMSGGRGHHKTDRNSEQQKKKPEDKGYANALARIPNQKYDAWQNMRNPAQQPGH